MDQDFAQIGFALSVITIVIVILILLLVNLMLTGRNRRLKHDAEMLRVQYDFNEQISTIRMEVAEATLNDVSRDLHDEVGQLLTFCILQLENVETAPSNKKEPMLLEVKKSVRDTLDSVRSISRGINTDFVNKTGLMESLRQLVERASQRTSRKISLHANPDFRIKNPNFNVIVFRIIRECLTNAIRHGNANEISIALDSKDFGAAVTILDNGNGFSTENGLHPGQGITSMQHYARLMKGDMRFGNRSEGGTEIMLTFPNV